MANRASFNCMYRRRQGQQLGLDELMIVNPGPPGTSPLFLGDDGTLYEIQDVGEEEKPQRAGEFFLGEDGTLYQVQGLASNGWVDQAAVEGLGNADGRKLGRYFLGEDGTLYELVDRKATGLKS